MAQLIGFLAGKDTVLIWDAEGVTRLRESHRIVGSLIGCLPTYPRQSNQLGLPLQLLPEETTLLVNEGVLVVKCYHPPFHEPTRGIVEIFQELLAKDAKKQFELHREKAAAQRARFVPGDSDSSTLSATSSSEAGRTDFSPLVCVHTMDPPATREACQYQAAKWEWPQSEKEILRYKVFSDLWRRGYYLTPGLKYGGDYLVYAASPTLVHSLYLAVIRPWSELFPASDLVTLGRLGAKVKKNVLLCSVGPEGSVVYHTLQWAGIA